MKCPASHQVGSYISTSVYALDALLTCVVYPSICIDGQIDDVARTWPKHACLQSLAYRPVFELEWIAYHFGCHTIVLVNRLSKWHLAILAQACLRVTSPSCFSLWQLGLKQAGETAAGAVEARAA